MKLSVYLRRKRFQLNLTQNQMAKEIGITTYYYNWLENGKKFDSPHPNTINKLATFLELPVEKVIKMYENNK